MAKFYAWSNFDVERNEWGQTTNVIHVGDEVTQNQLNISDSEWEDLVATGAVREEPYPDVPDDVSPAEYLRQRAASVDATEDEVAAYADILSRSGQADTGATNPTEEEVAASEAEAAAAPAPAPASSSSSSGSTTTEKS